MAINYFGQRDAEYQLPRLEAKEGKLLTMEDYNSINKWTLRYKWVTGFDITSPNF